MLVHSVEQVGSMEPDDPVSAPYYNTKENEPDLGVLEQAEGGTHAENAISVGSERQALAVVTNADVPLTRITAQPLGENAAAVYLAGLSPGSRRTMGDALDLMTQLLTGGQQSALELPWGQVRFQHTAAIRSKLAERYAPSTANKMLSALRGVLKAAWRLGQIEANEYQKSVDISAVIGESLPAGRSLALGELVSLLEVCGRDKGPLGMRDSAIVALLYGCGLRRAELVTLDVADYDAGGGTLKVRGKRNKQRLVPVVGGAQAALDDWLTTRGKEEGPLFVSSRKGGRLQRERLTTHALYKMLLVRAQQANVEHFSPHDFRRTFVGDLLDRGADIATVQKLAGHSNVTTTARYDRRGEATKRKAAEMLHVPLHTKAVSNKARRLMDDVPRNRPFSRTTKTVVFDRFEVEKILSVPLRVLPTIW